MSDLKRVEELTLCALDGEATEAELAELEALIQDDEAADHHLSLLDLEATLRGRGEDLDLEQDTMDRVRQAQTERVSAGVMDRIHQLEDPETPEPADARHPSRWRGVAVAAAAMLAVGAGVGSYLALRDRAATPDRTESRESRVLRDRMAKAEEELQALRVELSRLRVRERMLRQRTQVFAEREKKALSALQKEWQRLSKRQQSLVQSGQPAGSHPPDRRARARAELDKLAELRRRMTELNKWVSADGRAMIQKVLGEIARQSRMLATIIQVAAALRRPARRRMMPKAMRAYRAHRRPMRARPSRRPVAADAFSD